MTPEHEQLIAATDAIVARLPPRLQAVAKLTDTDRGPRLVVPVCPGHPPLSVDPINPMHAPSMVDDGVGFIEMVTEAICGTVGGTVPIQCLSSPDEGWTPSEEDQGPWTPPPSPAVVEMRRRANLAMVAQIETATGLRLPPGLFTVYTARVTFDRPPHWAAHHDKPSGSDRIDLVEIIKEADGEVPRHIVGAFILQEGHDSRRLPTIGAARLQVQLEHEGWTARWDAWGIDRVKVG